MARRLDREARRNETREPVIVAKRIPLAIGKWTGGAIVAAAHIDREALRQVEAGEFLEIYRYRLKSDDQNRYLHAMLQDAADNGDGWTVKSIKNVVKLRGGWINGVIERRNGEAFCELRSTADFDREEMKMFIDEAERLIESEILPGVDMNAMRLRAKEAAKARRERGPR